jgi:catechol 2,3-dioxygenase-like lactoylglutathione lyase family enzyme
LEEFMGAVRNCFEEVFPARCSGFWRLAESLDALNRLARRTCFPHRLQEHMCHCAARDDLGMADRYPELCSTVLDTTDARRLAEFYRELLGYVYRPGDETPAAGEPDPSGEDWLVLRDREGGTRLAFQHVDELPAPTWPDPAVSQQLHLDLMVDTIAELTEQHERALGLGATLLEDRFDDPREALYVYADPAGHPFCILAVEKPPAN